MSKCQELYTSETGGGKSSIVRLRTRADLTDPNTSVIVVGCVPGTLSWDLYKDAIALGQGHRTVLEDFDDINTVVSRDWLPRSSKPGIEGWRENLQTIELRLDGLSRRRGFISLDDHPAIQEYAEPALWLMLEQEPRKAISHLEYAFRPRSTEFGELLRDCRDESISQQFRHLPAHASSLDRLVGPAKRFTSILWRSPSIASRDKPGGREVVDELLDRGMHYFVQGGHRITQEEWRFVCATISLAVIRYKETGGLRRVAMVFEEAEANASIGPIEARAVKTLRKADYNARILCQNLWFHSPEVTRDIINNTDHWWGPNSSDEIAEMAGRDLSGVIDPYALKEIEYDTRQTHIGWEQVPIESETALHRGGTNRTISFRERPIYQYELRERRRYFPISEQIALLKKWNMEFSVGQGFAKSNGRASYVVTPKPDELIDEATARRHYEEHRKRWPFTQNMVTNFLGFDQTAQLIGGNAMTTRSLSIPIRRRISKRSEPDSSPLTRWQHEGPENSVGDSGGEN